jgi:hypothetical protein
MRLIRRRLALAAACALIALAVVACDGDSDGNGDGGGDGGARPAGVPEHARLVEENVTVGDPGSREGGETDHLFFSSTCTEDVVNVVSTDGTFYAELPCDRAVPQETAGRFLGKSVQIRAVIGAPSKLFVDSAAAGTIEFTVGRIWQAPP